MNAMLDGLTLDFAIVDASGRLIETDDRFAALNARAGGAIGAPIAVPQIATLIRLAQRLGVLVSRSVLAADGSDDLDLWVRAEPVGDSTRVAIGGWRRRSEWLPAGDGARQIDFLRTSADFLWETDAALRLTRVSPEAAARLGFDATAVLGAPLTRLFSLTEDGEGALPMLSAVAAQDGFENQRAEIRGTSHSVRLAATARTDSVGRFAGLVGAAYVLSLGASDHPSSPQSAPVTPQFPVFDAFGARLDSALRAPLGRIIANADSISAQSEGPLRQDYADYASDIASAGRHLLDMVGDLVDLQAIERPGFRLATEPVDLADVSRRAAGLLAVRAAEVNVRIDKPSPDERLPATGEFRRTLQILVNLIGNAIRYSPAGGMIWIRTEREGDLAAVIVADQGKGIAETDQDRIFEKFERVDPGEAGGSGLGLYIARRLARAMGGDITVDSAPGQGARFVLTLPLDA